MEKYLEDLKAAVTAAGYRWRDPLRIPTEGGTRVGWEATSFYLPVGSIVCATMDYPNVALLRFRGVDEDGGGPTFIIRLVRTHVGECSAKNADSFDMVQVLGKLFEGDCID